MSVLTCENKHNIIIILNPISKDSFKACQSQDTEQSEWTLFNICTTIRTITAVTVTISDIQLIIRFSKIVLGLVCSTRSNTNYQLICYHLVFTWLKKIIMNDIIKLAEMFSNIIELIIFILILNVKGKQYVNS